MRIHIVDVPRGGWRRGRQRVTELDPIEFCQLASWSKLDTGIRKILLVLDLGRLNLAVGYDLACAVKELRRRGVFVAAYADRLDLPHLLAMSGCDLRFAPPMAGPLDLGLAHTHYLAADTLSKFGVRIGGHQCGTHKLTRLVLGQQAIAAAAHEADISALREIHSAALAMIVEGTGVALDAACPGVFATAADAAAAGLLTATCYGELLPSVDSRLRAESWTNVPTSVRRRLRSRLGWIGQVGSSTRTVVGLVHIGEDRLQSMAYRSGGAIGAILAAVDGGKVGALLIVVDVVGGSFADADRLAAVCRTIALRMPVLVYARNAVSAGFCIALGGQQIIANPCSRLGGVGTTAVEVDFDPLLHRLGIGIVRSEVGHDPAVRTETATRRAQVAHELFVRRVCDGRQVDRVAVADLVDGRVFSSARALDAKLVDCRGSLVDALASIAKLLSANVAPRLRRLDLRGAGRRIDPVRIAKWIWQSARQGISG